MIIKRLFLAVGCVAAVGIANAQNIVQNPGFELPYTDSTDFPDWTVAPGTSTTNGSPGIYTGLDLGVEGPHQGNNWITLSAFASDGPGSISQTLNTVAGQEYTLSFWMEDTTLEWDQSVLNVNWGGSLALDATKLLSVADVYQQFSTTVTATSNTTVLQFYGQQNIGWTAFDDVSVTAVPEPFTLALCAGGLGLALARRRRCT